MLLIVVLDAMLTCGELEALVGDGLGFILAPDCIFTEFSLSTESVKMKTKIVRIIAPQGCLYSSMWKLKIN